jgi:GNAT superfamily N-acetyltransferase
VRRLEREDQLAGVESVLAAVWGGSCAWVRPRLGLHMDTPGYIEVYAAYLDGVPACVGWTYFQPGSAFASLWAGSTLPEYRGRGLYTALTAARVQSALRRGRRYAVVSAGAMSAPIVARNGFTELTRDLVYAHPAGFVID